MTKAESLDLLEKCKEFLKNSTDEDKRKMQELYFSELNKCEKHLKENNCE